MVAVAPDAQPSRTSRLQAAVLAVIEDHRDGIDADDSLAAVRFEVRFAPDGKVRRVMIDRSSEYSPRR